MEEKDNVVLETENINEEPIQEEVKPAKSDENVAKKNTFKSYLYGIWYNFVDSFRYNPCKLAGILVALPGLFIGFFLGFHSQVTFLTLDNELDFSGALMFILVLMGCINIANGVTLSSKKNLGTVITSTICSVIILICGIFWIQRIFYSKSLVDSGRITLDGAGSYDLTFTVWMSIISVILSMVCSIAGCILGYIKRDKNYKKVTM
ncbi:MAG: hypothetical protein K2K48_05630 [Anaeroplasmataceae bacterium]|nr:hypothetical protein [Anaeroplasmataceae bacterium]MDE6414875.1 hypothetical protein [Anaeroplasmataceae bacterium]